MTEKPTREEIDRKRQRLAKLIRQRDLAAQKLGGINIKIYNYRQWLKEHDYLYISS